MCTRTPQPCVLRETPMIPIGSTTLLTVCFRHRFRFFAFFVFFFVFSVFVVFPLLSFCRFFTFLFLFVMFVITGVRYCQYDCFLASCPLPPGRGIDLLDPGELFVIDTEKEKRMGIGRDWQKPPLGDGYLLLSSF